MNQEGRVTTERQGHVLLIGLDRVAQRNAFDMAMVNALWLAYAELEHGDEFNAAEALRIGLVQEVVEPGQQLTRATELAQVVSAQAPLGVRATLKSARLAIAEGEEAAIQQFLPDLQALMQSEDIKEGVQPFIDRRQANFKVR